MVAFGHFCSNQCSQRSFLHAGMGDSREHQVPVCMVCAQGEAVWSPGGGLGAVGDPAPPVAVLILDPCVEESDHAQMHL